MPHTEQIVVENPEPQLSQSFPWIDERGVIVRTPTAEEAKIWHDLQVQSQTDSLNGQEDIASQRTVQSLGRGMLARLGIKRNEKLDDGSLLGTKKRNTEYVSQPSTSEFGYGNEQDRLSALKHLTFGRFKEKLLKLNKEFRATKIDDAEGYEGFTKEGRLAASSVRVPHRYPDGRDVQEVLQYALEQAKVASDVQDAALILSGGVVAAHPFADGNGRVSRAIYSELSMGLHPGLKGHSLATESSRESLQEFGGSALFNIGSGFLLTDPQMKAVHRNILYERLDLQRSQLIPAGYTISFQNKRTGLHDTFSQLHNTAGLDVASVDWLNILYENFQGFKYDLTRAVGAIGEDESFMFALSYAEKNAPTKLDKYKLVMAHDKTTINVNGIFSSADPELLGMLAEGTRQYYKEYALAYIDMLGPKSRTMIDNPHGSGKTSIRGRIVELSNNALAEKLSNKYVSLEKRTASS